MNASEKTRQPTMNQLLAAARKRWKNAIVEHSPKAPDRATRELWAQLNHEARARKKEIDGLLKTKPMATILRRITDAAKFVCDVDGGAPSIDQLRPVTADAVRYFELKEEWETLNDATKDRPTHWKRFRVIKGETVGGIAFGVHVADADTAAELMDKINERKDG